MVFSDSDSRPESLHLYLRWSWSTRQSTRQSPGQVRQNFPQRRRHHRFPRGRQGTSDNGQSARTDTGVGILVLHLGAAPAEALPPEDAGRRPCSPFLYCRALLPCRGMTTDVFCVWTTPNYLFGICSEGPVMPNR